MEKRRPLAVETRWRWLLIGLWLYAAIWLTLQNFGAIAGPALPDPDDNLRLAQVRDWIAGQGWFDLRQHRLAPQGGADIHWTRLIDLPLAGTMLALAPLLGAGAAETVAIILVPLLTLLAAMTFIASIARRLIAPDAWFWAAALLLMASQARSLMSPLRIDHHGWQLVLLLAALLGLITNDRRAGGIIAGAAIALSLAIGIEMTPFLALAIGMGALCWIAKEGEAIRLRWMTGSACIGVAAALILFVPPPERMAWQCDALSLTFALPLFLGGAILNTATLFRLSAVWRATITLVAAIAAGAPLLGPAGICLADPYHALDPAARALWLNAVVEAIPLYEQPAGAMLATLFLPLAGSIGAIVMIARMRGKAEALRRWIVATAFGAFSLALAIVQTRSLAAAELLAVPGVAALCWVGRSWLTEKCRSMPARALGTAIMFLFLSGLPPKLAWTVMAAQARDAPARPQPPCMAPEALRALDRLPPGVALTFIDAAPPLLVHTRHRALAGPYHRNGRVIADVMTAWASPPDAARPTLDRYGVRWIFLCGSPDEATLYRDRAEDGLYVALAKGKEPWWLERQPVRDTPWRVWKISGRFERIRTPRAAAPSAPPRRLRSSAGERPHRA